MVILPELELFELLRNLNSAELELFELPWNLNTPTGTF
jgi:hypothetical protein